jgi:hypothetical protein
MGRGDKGSLERQDVIKDMLRRLEGIHANERVLLRKPLYEEWKREVNLFHDLGIIIP